ncbi:MAG: RNA polymerase sigma-70 factor [Bacteroidota bacterium]|jgi:RNA polymerase sigma-70 factor, ECF subfamily
MNPEHGLSRSQFEILFRTEYKGMLLFAIHYVKEEEAAKEIVQEAFINLWEKRESINPEREVKSYLSASVRNRSLNYLRDNKRFNGTLLSLGGLLPMPAAEEVNTIEIRELSGQIHRAIEELPEKCREVFRLNRFEQMKYQEIADHLNISIKTVETQMSKALSHLRSRIRQT